MVTLFCILAPFPLLYALFPLYASVYKAYKAGNLRNLDFVIFGFILLIMLGVDLWCNVLASLAYWELPFLRGEWTLSKRSSYWVSFPDSHWRYHVARIVKGQTDKFDKTHILPMYPTLKGQ